MTARQRLRPNYLAHPRIMPAAMIDRVKLVAGDLALCGDASAVTRTLGSLPAIQAKSSEGVSIRLLNTPKINADGSQLLAAISAGTRIEIESDPSDEEPSDEEPSHEMVRLKPIISGELRHCFGKDRIGSIFPQERIRIAFAGTVNVNRYLLAQRYPRFPHLERPRMYFPPATAVREGYLQYEEERTLIESSNSIIGHPGLIVYAESQPSEVHFLDMITAIDQLIDLGVRENAAAYDVVVRRRPYYSIQEIEFCWEFDHPAPISFVEGLRLPVRALALNSEDRSTKFQLPEMEFECDSTVLVSWLSASCCLAIYAKSTAAVRFEIRLFEDDVSRILKGRRTSQTRDALLWMVRSLRIEATARFERALVEIDRLTAHNPTPTLAIRFCGRIGSIIEDTVIRETVLDLLATRGSLAAAKGSELRPVADLLAKHGILRRSKRPANVYAPTDAHVEAVASLRQLLAR